MVVSLVDNQECDAEVAAHCYSGDEKAAAVQRGEEEEEEEAVDGADGRWQPPALKQNLHGLEGQPGHEHQVGHAQIEGVDQSLCTYTKRTSRLEGGPSRKVKVWTE